MTANTQATAEPTNNSFPLTNPLRALHQAVEEAGVFKREMGSRLTKMLEQNRQLHAMVEARDSENRRLKAQVQSLESDNKRLARDNEVLLRNQQTIESAIQLACGTFMDTTQFVAEATRASIPSLPSAYGESSQTPPSNLGLVKQQPITSVKAPLDTGAEPRREIKPLGSYASADASSEPAEITLEGMEAMTAEIDAMLAKEFGDALVSDDSASVPAEAASAAEDGEPKAA